MPNQDAGTAGRYTECKYDSEMIAKLMTAWSHWTPTIRTVHTGSYAALGDIGLVEKLIWAERLCRNTAWDVRDCD